MFKSRNTCFKEFCEKEMGLPNGVPSFSSSGDFSFDEFQQAFNAGWAARKREDMEAFGRLLENNNKETDHV